jgi:iron complex outermembrane receptor protein
MMKSVWLMSAGLFALAAPAAAQDNTQSTGETTPTEEAGEVNPNADVSPTDEVGSNDIVITAQGRQQILQDVPIAVTAINAESMQNSGATDIRQLNQLAPSLLVSSTGTEANGSARIRGIGTVGDNPGLESSVAVFIDGVYRSRSGIGLNELGEIERVEVLRGPQGTLFGRNASAGLIHVISKKPNMNEMEGYAEASYGNYDFIRVAGGLTGPIGDSGFGYRVEGVYVERDGYYRVNDPQGGTESRVNDRDRLFVRGQLLYEPADNLEFRLIGDYTTRDESCCGAVYLSTLETTDPTPDPFTADGQPQNIDGRVQVQNNRIVDILRSLGETFPSLDDPYSRVISVTPGRSFRGKTEDWGLSGQVDWDVGFGSLTSITAYRDYSSEQPGDVDYGRADILFREDDGNAFRKFQTFSQELRLQGSAFDDRLDWLVGAYFAKEDLHVRDNLKFGSQYGAFAACRIIATISPALPRSPASPGCFAPPATGFPGTAALVRGAFAALGPGVQNAFVNGLTALSNVNNVGDDDANYFQDSRNYALFTHNIFKISDQLSLTLGLRYTNEKKEFEANFNNSNTVCPTQQAQLVPVLGAIPAVNATINVRRLLAGIINLTCQGNSSSALNALNLSDERKEDEWTGTGILSYKPDNDWLFYASFAKGYKAGGFNLDRSALGSPIFPPNSPANTGGRGLPFGTGNLQFDAEKVDAYELGVKYGRRNINFSVAAFRQEFKNFQLNTFNGSVFLVQNINGCGTDLGAADMDASATTGACDPDDVEVGVISQGIELEAAFFPIPEIAFTAGFTYADTEYQDDLVGRDTGAPLDPALWLLPGDNLSNAPQAVVTASFSYTPQLTASGISGLFYVDTRMTGDFNTGSDLFPEKEQDGYALVNARVGVRGPEQRWGIELWAQNLFNQDYQQVAFNTPFQGGGSTDTGGSAASVPVFGGTSNQIFSSFLAEPRTYGITVRTKF